MLGHILPSANPLVDVEVFLTEPAVPITLAAAPLGFGDVVVEVQDDILGCEFIRNGIKYLSLH